MVKRDTLVSATVSLAAAAAVLTWTAPGSFVGRVATKNGQDIHPYNLIRCCQNIYEATVNLGSTMQNWEETLIREKDAGLKLLDDEA